MRGKTPWPHQHICWCIQDFQARQLGSKPPEPQLDSVLRPVQVVQVQLCQAWQRRQRPQVARANALNVRKRSLVGEVKGHTCSLSALLWSRPGTWLGGQPAGASKVIVRHLDE